MLFPFNFWGWPEKRIRSVWKIEKEGQASFLVGTAHFSPCSFQKSLERLVERAEVVIFEGPLDDESMARVAAYGRSPEQQTPSLYEALSPEAVEALNEELALVLDGHTKPPSHLDFLPIPRPNYVEAMAAGVRPWMGFFTIWSTLLNWKHSMDVEAYRIALRKGKKIAFLETIDDQLRALDGIPFDRIVNFFHDFPRWKYYRRQYLKIFLSGDIDKFASMLAVFPTRCDSILTNRDPIFFAGIKRSIDQVPTTAFVGNAHILGLHKLFLAAGYRITQEVV